MTKTVSTEVLAVDLKYLKKGIDDIKAELKLIREDKVGRERFDLVNQEQDKRIGMVEKLVFGTIILAISTMGKTIIEFFINASP
jgi:hypothetical protein